MDPTTLLMVASSVMSAAGSIQQGNSAKAAAEYNARVAENNAITARQQAAAQEEQHRRLARRQLGQMRAAYGASGVTMEGSPLDILAQSAKDAELDALNIRYGGELKAQGLESEAVLERYRGKSAQRAGYMGAATGLLSGASKIMVPR